MGTINFTVGKYARTRGQGAASIMSTDFRTSDAYTSTTSATFIEDGSGDIVLAAGEVFRARSDTASWVRFGGDAATVGDGFELPADFTLEWEVETPGKVSVIEG